MLSPRFMALTAYYKEICVLYAICLEWLDRNTEFVFQALKET